MSGIDTVDICPRCHGGGAEPALSRELLKRISELLRPAPCYVCDGAGHVQQSIAARRMGELGEMLLKVMQQRPTGLSSDIPTRKTCVTDRRAPLHRRDIAERLTSGWKDHNFVILDLRSPSPQ